MLGGDTLAQNARLLADTPVDHEVGPVMIGSGAAFQQMIAIADAVASNDCVVLIEGESGTGKELVAQRIHNRSNRAANPLIPVNCPAVAESLFESQFYGHVKGSFTGAQGDTLGMVRAAEHGPLFLDQIGELPLHLQPKLLRLLQEREVTPVGGTKAISVNVRFIAATNRSLAKAVADGKFRRDLYHRLNIVRLQVPPLRNRVEDIDPLVDFFLDTYADEYAMDRREIPVAVRDALMAYPWPGNIRELSGWVERLYAANLPAVPPTPEIWDDRYATGEAIEQTFETIAPSQPISASLVDAEFETIQRVLDETNHNRSAAAKRLNIHRTTLLRKMRQFGLR